jgi:hypothetical protein
MAASPLDKYAISVVLWGGDNPRAPSADPAGHMALAVHADVPQPAVCHLHHARCPDQVRFIYESRPAQPFAADPAPRGRCDLHGGLSETEAQNASDVLARFGADQAHLPFYGRGNCHDWTAAAVGALEEAGFAEPGDAQAWAKLVGKGPRAMQRIWVEEKRRRWVDCDQFGDAPTGAPDARWGEGDDERRAPEGETRDTGSFKDRVANLQKLMRGENG